MEQEKIYQIFVSSTFKDLEQERQEVLAAIVEKGYVPVGMEYFPSTNATPFEYIKKMLEKVDYYILIIAGKYGSIEATSGLSYTELEYDYAQQLGIPTMVFLYKDITGLSLSANESNPAIREKLDAFRKKASATLAKMWTDKHELKAQVSNSISHTIKEYPRIGWIRADQSEQIPDDFDYTQIAYVSRVNDINFWEMNHDGETFTSKNVTWQNIVENVFPHLQSMNTRYDVYGLIKSKCGEITDEDFNKVFLTLQSMLLISSETITFPEGGCDVYFHLTNKGTAALLKFHKIG